MEMRFERTIYFQNEINVESREIQQSKHTINQHNSNSISPPNRLLLFASFSRHHLRTCRCIFLTSKFIIATAWKSKNGDAEKAEFYFRWHSLPHFILEIDAFEVLYIYCNKASNGSYVCLNASANVLCFWQIILCVYMRYARTYFKGIVIPIYDAYELEIVEKSIIIITYLKRA